MKVIFCLFALFVPVFFAPLAQATDPASVFRGNWSGKGTYIHDGRLSQCGEFKLTFAGTPDSFEFVTGNRKCDFHEEEFVNVKMEVRNGELFFYGQKVGSFQGNELNSSFRAPEGNGRFRFWRMTMRRQGNHLMYEESRTMDGESTPLISFSGMLILQNP